MYSVGKAVVDAEMHRQGREVEKWLKLYWIKGTE